jgi:predicted ATPase
VNELVVLGQQSGDESLLLEALHCRWSTAFFRGDVQGILTSVDEGLKLYDSTRHGRLGAEFGGHDPGVCARTVAALAYLQLGSRRDAIESVTRGIDLARRLNQPPSEAFAIMNALTTYQMIGDRDTVLRLTVRMTEIADRFLLPAQRSLATFMAAWARACGDNLEVGLKAMESEFPRVTIMGPIPVFYSGLLANVRLEAGQAALALELLDEVLKRVKEPNVGLYLPEIRRLRGECLLRLDPGAFDQAVLEFETAIAIAKEQQARIFQLAAAVSLARATAAAGSPERGIAALAEIVSAFGEDHDAPQLALARTMLATP